MQNNLTKGRIIDLCICFPCTVKAMAGLLQIVSSVGLETTKLVKVEIWFLPLALCLYVYFYRA